MFSWQCRSRGLPLAPGRQSITIDVTFDHPGSRSGAVIDPHVGKDCLHRRAFLGGEWGGWVPLARASLLDPSLVNAAQARRGEKYRGAIQPLHLPAKVKRVIFLYMSGGPSQFESFDPKPMLAKMDG